MYYCTWCSALVVHTVYDPALHSHSQHNQCRTPYAVIHGLVLLMMGIMMPKTCSDRSLIINIGLVASCWFISLHPMLHDARSQEPKTCMVPIILNLGTRWQVANLPLWKKLWVPIGYVAQWSSEQMQMLWTKEKFPALPGIETAEHPACHKVTVHTMLFQLQ